MDYFVGVEIANAEEDLEGKSPDELLIEPFLFLSFLSQKL